MLNPARRHFQRTMAAQAATAARESNADSMQNASVYELQLAKLGRDRHRLKQIQSEQGKAKVKSEILPEYDAYIRGVLDSDAGVADNVVTTVMIWRIDAGDYAGALEIAEYVIRHNLPMPDQFKRSPGCLIAEEIANTALRDVKSGAEFDIEILRRTWRLTESQDMPDEVRAKLLAALALSNVAMVDDEQIDAGALERLSEAESQMKKAIALYGKVGLKKNLEAVERLLKKHTAPPLTGEPE